MTIALDDVVYNGLEQTVGKRKISQFISELLRPHVLNQPLDDSYKAMAKDEAREAEALDWSNATIQDFSHEAR